MEPEKNAPQKVPNERGLGGSSRPPSEVNPENTENTGESDGEARPRQEENE